MKPIKFKEQNCILAEDQPQYQPLPVYRAEDGQVISCWSLTFKERLRVLFSGKIWYSVLTFNKPLQPQLPSIDSPFIEEK